MAPLSYTPGTSKGILRNREDPSTLFLVVSTHAIKWNSHLVVCLRGYFSPLERVYGLLFGHWALRGNGRDCGEIDVMENVGEPDWASVAVHGPGYSGETPLVNKKYFLPDNFTTSWHIYSLECTAANGLLFKIDGELIYRVTRPMVEFYGSWVFSDPKYLILNFALGGTYPHKTNGDRSPYYGIPEKTVQSIQNNDAKMLIDWVKVTRMVVNFRGLVT